MDRFSDKIHLSFLWLFHFPYHPGICHVLSIRLLSYIWHLAHFPCLYFSICLPFWMAPLTENCSDLLASFPVFLPILYSPIKPLRGCDLISPISVALLIAELVITIVIANTLQAFLCFRHHLSLCKYLTYSILTSTLMQGIIIIVFLPVWRWIYGKVLFRIWTGIRTRLSSSRPMPYICSCIASLKRDNWSQRGCTELVWLYLTFLVFSLPWFIHTASVLQATSPQPHPMDLSFFAFVLFISWCPLPVSWDKMTGLCMVYYFLCILLCSKASPFCGENVSGFWNSSYPYQPYYLSYFNLFWDVDSHGTLMWIMCSP